MHLSSKCPPLPPGMSLSVQIVSRIASKWVNKVDRNDHQIEGSFVMKLYVDTSAKQVTVTREPTEKMEQNGRQKVERGTGRPMWSTQVFVLDDEGGEVTPLLRPARGRT